MPVKIAIAQINSTVGDLDGNGARIIDFATRAAARGADIVVTPELSLTGSPAEDLLLDKSFYAATQKTLFFVADKLSGLKGLHVLVGYHLIKNNIQYNVSSVLSEGRVLYTYCKHALPDISVLDEKRYFSHGTASVVFSVKNLHLGIAIGEDAVSPAFLSQIQKAGVQTLLVPASSPFSVHLTRKRQETIRRELSRRKISVIYTNRVGGQDDLVFDGNSFALDESGDLCAKLKHCEEDMEVVCFEGSKLQQGRMEKDLSMEEIIYRVLVLGTHDYVRKNRFPGIIIGLSGGIDSALVLAIACDAIGKENIHAVMLPSPYTSSMSKEDAEKMASSINVRYSSISITECFDAFKNTLSEQFAGMEEDITEENIQARVRGTLLMALSNKTGNIVLTTGNKSELAVGYGTLYGDMAGGFAVISDVPKTLVYKLCRYRNSISPIIPERILTREPSAELRHGQRDQDSLPPYDILDNVIDLFLSEGKSIDEIVDAGFDKQTVEHILFLIRRNEFKRRQAPLGIRLAPRLFGRDWRLPVTSKYKDQ